MAGTLPVGSAVGLVCRQTLALTYGGNEQNEESYEALDVPFYNEDHDYPSDVPGYGVVGWTKGDEQVLIYDKFDVWSFATRNGQPINITGGQGRAENRIFRVIDADRSGNPVGNNGELLLSSYHDLRKNFGFYSTDLEDTKVTPLLEEDKKFTFVAKARDSDAILYKREAYDEFPNLWVAKDASFETVQQHTQLYGFERTLELGVGRIGRLVKYGWHFYTRRGD